MVLYCNCINLYGKYDRHFTINKSFVKLLSVFVCYFAFVCLPLCIAQDSSNLNKTILIDSLYDTDYLSVEFHKGRREALRSILPEKSVAVFFSSSIKNRSNDVDYEFHQDPNFYYLTGYKEPNAALFIFKEMQPHGMVHFNELIFVQPREESYELWYGKRLGVEGVKNKLGIDYSYKNEDFADFPLDLYKYSKVFYQPDDTETKDNKKNRGDLHSLKKHFLFKLDSTNRNVDRVLLKEMMSNLRQVKEKEEIVLLRKAIDITCNAQARLMRELNPGTTEYQAEALIEYVFKAEGAEYPGFPSIVGGGENSCVLHYTANRKLLMENDLLVVDVGAEYHGYSADVTRTMPVSGKFSEEQKIIYNIVLEAQEYGIKACTPGNKFWAPDKEAIKIVAKRLIQHGIVKNYRDYRKYFMHGTSHYLGLDVHDVGLYGVLSEGNVLTVEPGIYIPEGSDCDPKWWNIGVRIEDDILITNSGYEVLSDCVPKKISEIEQLMERDKKNIEN